MDFIHVKRISHDQKEGTIKVERGAWYSSSKRVLGRFDRIIMLNTREMGTLGTT